MSAIWMTQTGTIFLVLALATWWVIERRRFLVTQNEARFKAGLNVLELRANEHEAEWKRFREEIQAQLSSLNRICSQAQTILEKGQGSLASSVPTLEEFELKAVINEKTGSLHEVNEIPSLKELEKTNIRLRSEISFDLNHLLKEQLA